VFQHVHQAQSRLDLCLCFDLLVTVNVDSFMSLGQCNTIQHSGSGEAETDRKKGAYKATLQVWYFTPLDQKSVHSQQQSL